MFNIMMISESEPRTIDANLLPLLRLFLSHLVHQLLLRHLCRLRLLLWLMRYERGACD